MVARVAGVTPMIRVEAIWLAVGASDLRGGIDRLLGLVISRFGSAQRHHAYVFANRRATRLKVLVFDGAGMWLCTRRLQEGSFAWPQDSEAAPSLSPQQWAWLVAGLPWQRMAAQASVGAIRRV
ncbi:IS66 Orf2 like protein [mine drainage metagenome]|uniref:IS66 Orf2 like protein n=1 Tax=mine drainage metagenome TaxID=410659 RepID=A0A1J5QFK5_9ZZZZ